MDVLKKTPVREQDPKVRATNFEEVCLGYNREEAMEEASRCINCKNAQCIKGCPVSINIPGFIEKVKNGDVEGAYQVISESSALPAVCGRVCPQESQCEGKCIVASRVSRFPSASWNVSLQILQEKPESSLRVQKRKTARRLL